MTTVMEATERRTERVGRAIRKTGDPHRHRGPVSAPGSGDRGSSAAMPPKACATKLWERGNGALTLSVGHRPGGTALGCGQEAGFEDPAEASNCVHYWILEPALGSKSKGVCRRCGEVGEFDNYWDEDRYVGGTDYLRNFRRAPGFDREGEEGLPKDLVPYIDSVG